MTIPGWIIILILVLVGIRQIFKNAKTIRRIDKTEKIMHNLDEIEADLKEHQSNFENTPSKDNVITFPMNTNE